MTDSTSSSRRLPASVWMLGMVSMLTDISTEMVSGLLPVFLMTQLAVSASVIGLIEGVAGGTTMLVKAFSGSLSDYLGRRKILVLIGYGLSAAAKPLLAAAGSVSLIASARVMDRTGKGIRDAPRDALIADVTDASMRGAAYGLRQSLDTVGAFVGPLLAMGLMVLWANDYRAVFWVATVPAVLAFLLLYFGVREPVVADRKRLENPLTRANLRLLRAPYWWLVAIGAGLTLARFSEAFLVLRAQHDGLPLALTPLVLIAMNVVYASLAYPFGQWSDRIDSKRLLGGSLIVLMGAHCLLARGGLGVWAGIALWGLHMAMAQGVMSALIANAAPSHLRGTAFGLFNVASGVVLLVASALAGLLWDGLGPAAPFLAGAIFATLTLVLVAVKPQTVSTS